MLYSSFFQHILNEAACLSQYAVGIHWEYSLMGTAVPVLIEWVVTFVRHRSFAPSVNIFAMSKKSNWLCCVCDRSPCPLLNRRGYLSSFGKICVQSAFPWVQFGESLGSQRVPFLQAGFPCVAQPFQFRGLSV